MAGLPTRLRPTPSYTTLRDVTAPLPGAALTGSWPAQHGPLDRQGDWVERAADIPWFAERRVTAENIASIENPLASREGLTELGRLVAAGAITARITTTEPLADAEALVERLRQGGVHGKAVIRT